MKTLTGLDACKTILDPVHGMIPITELELKIISTPIFQRLRRISQLSAVSLVYPGATHNRFQHSLGSLFIMDRFLSILKNENEIKTVKEDLHIQQINEIIKIMRISALLHDCGHLPFSHTFESRYNKEEDEDHEWFGSYVISNSEIGEILNSNEIIPGSIGMIIRGQVPMNEEYSKVFQTLVPLMHSDADVDRMDYILRDSYFTGVPFGKIDISRICDNITIKQNRVCFYEHAQDSLDDFLYSRYLIYKRVANHKTAICFDLIYQELYNFIEKYKDKIKLPFILPLYEEIKNGDKSWYNNEFCNLDELDFFRSIKTLINEKVLSNSDRFIVDKLYSRKNLRKSIKLCYLFDNLNEIEIIKGDEKKGEICKKEAELYEELKKNPKITSHWSFLRHNPSKPLNIVSSFNKKIEDEQDPNQIQIFNKEDEKIIPLQKRSNSIINRLATHHRVFIAYYHDVEESRKNIKEKAHEFLDEFTK